jgi:hypothetical protein
MKNFHVPIPTTYKGVQYRSRLEAKWAVFFEKLGFYFSYERYNITNENGDILYVPDFYIYEGINDNDWVDTFFIEIKPSQPSQQYLDYLASLPLLYNQTILIMVGEPSFSQKQGYEFLSFNPCDHEGRRWSKGFSLVQCKYCSWYNLTIIDDDCPTCRCNTRFKSEHYARGIAKNYRFDLENQKP